MIDRIKVRIFALIFLLLSSTAFCADRDALSEADSLFSAQRYTQALSIYSDLFQNGQATSSMLLKMAFIQDASGNYSEALYYLDLYYTLSADRGVVGKIEELADENELTGYRYSDLDFFQALFFKYQTQILLLLISMLLLLIAYIIRRSKSGEKSYSAFVMQIIVAIILIGITNFNPQDKGVITADQTLLRSGPSAGAEPIEAIQKGHKVTVLGQSDVWTKIIWEGNEVYIRNSRVKII